MMARFCCTLLVLVACQGWLLAEEFTAVISKVEQGKVTYRRSPAKKKDAERVLPASKNCRVFLAQYNQDTKKIEPGDEVAGGLKNDLFARIPPPGIDARVITDAEGKAITEIRIFQLKKKGS
jgi:hypothetical protein